jgi:hypothetical protein
MAETVDPSKTRRDMYNVSWNSVDLGGLDGVKPEFKMLLDPIKIGSLGKAKVGDRFVGLGEDAKVTIKIRETANGTLRGRLQKLMPWATQTTGAELALTPAVNVDLYSYAQALVLHPRGAAAVDEDLTLLKTVPVRAHEIPRTGTEDDVWEVEFLIYPDRSSLPALVYGKVTATP